MAELDLQVVASADDAVETYNTLDGFSGVSSLGDYNGPSYFSLAGNIATRHAGWRFQDVTIGQGTTILSAYFEAYVHSATYDDANFKLYGEDIDNAPAFIQGSPSNDITDRTKTTAFVSYIADSVGTGWWGSAYEATAIIQEIVDHPDWSSGNALALIGAPILDAYKRLRLRSFDYGFPDGGFAPKLYIKYATGVVTTRDAFDITDNSAVLAGTLGAGDYACGFEYGLTTGYGTVTPTQDLSGRSSYTQSISSLYTGTTYHFRALAGETEVGEDATFQTLPVPMSLLLDSLYLLAAGSDVGSIELVYSMPLLLSDSIHVMALPLVPTNTMRLPFKASPVILVAEEE